MNVYEQEMSPSSLEMDDPIANGPEAQRFKQAVDEGDMDVANNIFSWGNDQLKRYCVDYMASSRSPKFVGLIKSAKDNVKAWILKALLVHADPSLLDAAIDIVRPGNDLLRDIAVNVELPCLCRRFVYLLKRITDERKEEDAVRYGVYALVKWSRIECLDPLLSTIKKGAFLSQNLENVAIHEVFLRAFDCNDTRSLLVKHFFDHPAVSDEDYSNALYISYDCVIQTKELFHWLLGNADHQDLQAVKNDYRFSDMDPNFRDAVNAALQTVSSDPRRGITREEGSPVLKDTLTDCLPDVLIQEIADYSFKW